MYWVHYSQRHFLDKELYLILQEDQKLVLDQQMSEKEQIRLDLQQAKVQEAQDIAVAVQQHKADEARNAAAKRAAALKTKDLMANQVSPACNSAITSSPCYSCNPS